MKLIFGYIIRLERRWVDSDKLHVEEQEDWDRHKEGKSGETVDGGNDNDGNACGMVVLGTLLKT